MNAAPAPAQDLNALAERLEGWGVSSRKAALAASLESERKEFNRKADLLMHSATALREAARLREVEEERVKHAALLGFVTRMVWRKPELSDHEIVEAIRFYPDVHSNKLEWGRHAEDHNDEHLRTKLAQVDAARAALKEPGHG